MFCLIRAQKGNFDEVVFWAGEIYYSGNQEELWTHIWKMYYDFYAVTYPKYEKKINKMAKDGDNIGNIIYVLNLLYYSSSSNDVFSLRMMVPKIPSHVYFGRTPKWLKKLGLTKMENSLIRSIHNNQKINIKFYLNYFKDDPHRCYKVIKNYYNVVHGHTLKDKLLDSIQYQNKIHIITALILHLSVDMESRIQTRTVFKKIDHAIAANQKKFNEELVKPMRKTLVHKRLYKVSPLLGAFKLQRHSIDDISHKDILRLHWDYFACNTPLWNKRVKNYNGKCDDITREVVFPSDDEYEMFHEAYNYEPDEQSKEVQDKSIGDIDVNIGKAWLGKIVDFVHCSPIY
jgi:hypothetical protein